MKTTLRLSIAAVVALVIFTTASVHAQDYTFTVNDGTITITGYTGPGGVVSIPSTINGLPVTTIGQQAFGYRDRVTSVTIPGTVTTIGSYAFIGTGLTNLTIGSGVTTIGAYAFAGCGMNRTTLPDSVTAVGDGAFGGCSGLTDFNTGKGLVSIAYCMFSGCGSLTTITIGDSVTSIGDFAFTECISLPNVAIPGSVTSIGTRAFEGCGGLREVAIGPNVSSIGYNAFASCTNLSSIIVDPLNFFFSSLDGVLFDYFQTTVVRCPEPKAGSYAIPSNVASIGDGAFLGCSGLTSVTIPNSVTNIGIYAFADCTSLRGVYFRGNAPSIGPGVFTFDDKATVYYLPGTTGWGATFGGRPTALWLPNADSNPSTFGLHNEQFGFTIFWAPDRTVVVEASTTVSNPMWLPVATNTLSSDGTYFFSDSDWTNHTSRFYRLRSQ